LFKERFTQSELSQLIEHKEFLEADYFLFVRTVCHVDNLEYLSNTWCPRSCIYLKIPPKFIVKAQSKRFLGKLAKAAGFDKNDEFLEKLKKSHSVFTKYFRVPLIDDPLEDFDLTNLGTRS